MTETPLLLLTLLESLTSLERPEQREAFLNYTCRDDPAMRARLERLLSLENDSNDFFDIETALIPSDRALTEAHPEEENVTEGVGTRIGRYRLLERLGEGGCGVVYLAEQQEPVKRKVALKIIRLGMDTESVIARFEMERQALAMMDHPNIARVYDVGATRTGRPFFVMQLVDGEKITDYCNGKRLGIPERLKLFVKICHAIQHAHQKGVIHRDIKPSNILVWENDGEAVPKVIDFGIAKATAGGLDENATFTAIGQFVGTPAYMSPEQAAGHRLDVDTRSDIFSLGTLLYELLTGGPPFDQSQLQDAGADEIRRILQEVEPREPSAAVSSLGSVELREISAQRGCDPQKLAGVLRGDLDRILMKALEKDRKRRYGTADSLAADVNRYLNCEPVSARPSGRMYRLTKLVRRNKVAFSAGAAVLLALVAGLGASLWQYRKARVAEHHQAELRAVAEHALANEADLRERAESREMLTQSVVLLRKGDLEGASRILDGVKVPPQRPSLDGVTALRAVGEWLALQGRWQEASRCYQWLVEIDMLDPWGPVTLDCQAGGVVLAERGDIAAYRRYCEVAIGIQSDSATGDGRVLKSCLLFPPDENLRARLQPIAAATENWYNALPPDQAFGWVAIPSGLWRYRTGDYSGAIACAKLATIHMRSGAAVYPTARLIHAMASFRSGDEAGARRELDLARTDLPVDFKIPQDPGDSALGYWYDWLFARILFREAETLIGK